MHTKKELEATIDCIKQKKESILGSDEGTDLEYITKLQTLIKLENAAKK